MGYYATSLKLRSAGIQNTFSAVTPKPDYGPFRSIDPGQDLSGTLDGAGGVGGLLMAQLNNPATSNSATVFYCFDGNGNVMALVGASDGTVSAEYEYGPVGETMKATGPLAKANPFRFSTKPIDDETGLIIYQRRPYSPEIQRFISRDPIEEDGGENLYIACGNAMIGFIDPYGLKCVIFVTPTSDGKEKEVASASDVSIVKMKMIGKDGEFDGTSFDVDFSRWHGHCQEIKFILKIYINENLFSKTTHASGEYVGYNKHYVSGTTLQGGQSRNAVYGEVLAHEQGHARAYFEVLKPKIEQEFESFCNNAKYSKPKQRTALKQQIQAKLNTLRENTTYLQKTAEYPNNASVGHYSNDQYSPVKPPIYMLLPDLPAHSAMDYVWKKK